ncbi:hypothetical protein [Agromyces cerinus]|uniref:hypothetical protein n=1 Tax=Agromyces cerinus TaxID=33878 RepID=UPI0011781F42|nr:hypothetical protein [Agromyces cerinus]
MTADVLRNGVQLVRLRLDYEYEDDLEPGAFRSYTYSQLPRRNDQTPELPDGIGRIPMPYPDYGLEFSGGLTGHMKLRLHIHGDDLWIKDNVSMDILEVRQVATSFDSIAWRQDSTWSYVGDWTQDVSISQDPSEGPSVWVLAL